MNPTSNPVLTQGQRYLGGTVNFDTATGQRLAQGGTTYARPMNTNIPSSTPTTVVPKTIGTNPINIPPTQPLTPTTGNLSVATNTATGGITNDANYTSPTTDATTDANKKGLSDYLQKIMGNIGNQATQEDQFAQDQQLNEKKARATATSTEMDTLDKQFRDQVQNMKKNAQGQSTENLNNELAAANDTYQNTRANIALTYKVQEGDYNAAADIVNQKVSALEKQNSQSLQAYQLLAASVNNDLTDSQKLQVQANIQQKAEDHKTLQTAYATTLNQAVQNGAPASVLSAIDTASRDPNATQASIAQAAGKYGVDQSKQLDNEYKRSEIAKNYQAIKDAQNTNSSTVSITNDQGQQINIPTNVAPYYGTTGSGVGYIDASTLAGTAKEKTSIINAAQAAGLKVITNKNTAADIVNIKDAKGKLDSISTIMSGIAQPGWISRALYGLGMTKLAVATQSDPQKAAAGALSSIGLDILKAISGVQGFRGNQTAVQQVTDHLPKITDTVDTINQKISYINTLISAREDAIIGKPQGTSNNSDQIVNGVTYTRHSDGLYYPK